MPHLRRLVIATENPGRLAADEYRVHDPEGNGIDISQKGGGFKLRADFKTLTIVPEIPIVFEEVGTIGTFETTGTRIRR